MLRAGSFQTGLVFLMFMLSTPLILAQSPQGESEAASAVKGAQTDATVVQAAPAAAEPADAPPAPSGFDNSSVTPLMGGESFGLGSAISPHNFLLPSIQWTSYYGDNPSGYSQSSGPALQSTFVGDLKLQRVSRKSLFNLDYSGGGFYYGNSLSQTPTQPAKQYGSFDKLEFTEQISSRRWMFFAADQGTYMPESPLGFQGLGGLSTFGSGLTGPGSMIPGVNSYLTSNQSIISGNARRFDNTSIAQMQYSNSARSTWNVTGSYSTLQFLDPGYIDSDSINLTVGYTHAIRRGDSVSVNYLNTWMHFHVPNQDLINRGFMLGYGHQITGRVGVEVSGGLLFNQFALPLGKSITQPMFTTNDSLHYHASRYDMSVSFERGDRAGSGLLAGSLSEIVSGEISRHLFRTYQVSLRVDNAFNSSLRTYLAGQSNLKATYWEGNARVSHKLGQHISIYLEYEVQRQNINGAVCGTAVCAEPFTRQSGGIGLNWHARPIRLY